MAMNREQKRALQKAGQIDKEGAPIRERRDPSAAAARVRADRSSPREFVSEVRSEMKKVAWPTRQETLRLSLIVFVAILILGAFIFAIDLGFGKITDFLFPTNSNAAGVAASLFF